MSSSKLRALVFAGCCAIPNPSHAGDFLKNLANVAKPFMPPVPTISHPIPIPQPPPVISTIIPLPKPPTSVEDFKKEIAVRAQQLGNVAVVAHKISATPLNVAGGVVAQVGGEKASVVFDVLTAGERLQQEFTFTAAAGGAAILAGQDPLISVAMPLAAAIRAAREQHTSNAKPLPPEVIQLLSAFIPMSTLQRARYTFGEIRLSLPAIINGAQQLFENEYAVTVDDVIVFGKEVDFDTIDEVVWLSHELWHTKQYADWGVDLFAYNYLKNSRAVEDDARQAASYVRSYLEQVAKGFPPNAQMIPAQMPTFNAQPVPTPLGQTLVYKAPTASNPWETTSGILQ